MIYGLLAAFGIGLLIFVHELGHYLAARSIGVRVEVFSLGFGPRIAGFRRGPTDYRLSAVPLGGYVQVTGQDPTNPQHGDPGALIHRSVGKRFWFFSAGVLMNLLFAIVAFPFVFSAGVDFVAPVVGNVRYGGPAWQAGLEPGDEILTLNGKEMYSFENLTVEVALGGSKPITLEVLRDGQERRFTVQATYDESRGLYVMGIDPTPRDEFSGIEFLLSGVAERTGLRPEDQVVLLNGAPVTPRTWREQLELDPFAPTTISLTVERDGERLTREITTIPQELGSPQLGVSAARRRVLALRKQPALVELGLQEGDQIVALDGRWFTGEDWEAALDAGSGPVEIEVLRFPEEGESAARIEGSEGVKLTSDAPGIRGILKQGVALGPNRLLPAVIPRQGSPAAAAGIQAGDGIFSIGGKRIADWDQLVEAVQADRPEGAPISLAVLRPDDGGGQPKAVELEVTPATETYVLGLVPQFADLRRNFQTDGFMESLRTGFIATADLTKQLYVTLKGMFTGQVGANNLGGIITISKLSYDMAKWGLPRFLYFLALLSINLAVINLLPIPVLDGGHLLFLLVEKVRGAPVPERMFHYGQVLGLVLVLALLVFTFYNDIARWF